MVKSFRGLLLAVGILFAIFLVLILVYIMKPTTQQQGAVGYTSNSAICYDDKGRASSQGFVRVSPENSNAYQVCGPNGKWEPYSLAEKK